MMCCPSPQSSRGSGQDHVVDIIREKICHSTVAVVYEERRIGPRLPEVERCHMDDETLVSWCLPEAIK